MATNIQKLKDNAIKCTVYLLAFLAVSPFITKISPKQAPIIALVCIYGIKFIIRFLSLFIDIILLSLIVMLEKYESEVK